MKSKQLYLSATLLILAYACKQAIITKYSVGEPRVETTVSVNMALDRYSPGLSSYACVFKDSASFVDWFRNKNFPGRSVFFDSLGCRIITRDSGYCSGVDQEFAGQLGSQTKFRTDTSCRFTNLAKYIMKAGEKPSLKPSGFEYTCVIFWAKFLGRLNESTMAIARSALQSASGRSGKINLVVVNMDIMDFWKVSDSMIKTGTSPKQ